MDKSETILAIDPESDGDNVDPLVSTTFTDENRKRALTEMIIIDELPFSYVEGYGFKNLVRTICPEWIDIPTRHAVAEDCLAVYYEEKKKLKNAFKGQRLCLTTSTWTSDHDLNYMCVTAHYIDSDWNFHKRVLNFRIVESLEGEILGKELEACLNDWGVEEILSVTVDDVSSDNLLIDSLKRRTKNWKGIIAGHEFLHMRCFVHILKLVVRDALKEMDDSITKVRNAVRYVKSTPERSVFFKDCIIGEKIECTSTQICWDISTSWNHTYLMLENALKFKFAFERLEDEDLDFARCLREGDVGDMGPPNTEDWEKIEVFVKFLKMFYDATLKFSRSNNVTCSNFFMELMSMKRTIEIDCNSVCRVGLMASSMKSKLDKYLGDFDNMNPLPFIALALDPRYKLNLMQFIFTELYGAKRPCDLINKVREALNRLYESYAQIEKENNMQQSNGVSSGNEANDSSSVDEIWSQYWQYVKDASSMDSMSDVERYLNERCEVDCEGFDVLLWWKVNSGRYRLLSLVARHVLALPISTVASEYAFSTGRNAIGSFRSTLAPHMVEALVCSQNWLSCNISSSPVCHREAIREAMEDAEVYDDMEIESESTDEASSTYSDYFVVAGPDDEIAWQ